MVKLMAAKDPNDDLMAGEKAVSTSRLGRLFNTGRSAVGLARTMLGRRDGELDLESLRKLTRRLGELKGLGMKLGQILSFIDPTMPAEMRALLSVLQRQAPASEQTAVRQTVVDAFGARADVLLAAMDPKPFSVASIGQVHRAELSGYGPLAVKVLHPGIKRALQNDFATALGGLGVADLMLLGMVHDAKGLAEEVKTAILAECDFAQEAAYQREYFNWLRNDDTLIVPEVIDAWSAATVLTTRWEPGDPLEVFLGRNPSQAQRDRAGAALFRASVRGFRELGLLHGDPHPGNYAFREDGHVVLYDFGCVRRFTREQTEAFALMAEALRTYDRAALLKAAQQFGFRVSGDEQAALLERFARSFFAPMLVKGPSVMPADLAFEARQIIKDKFSLMKLGLPPHLLFLLRLRFGLYAVLSRIGSCCDWGALEIVSISPRGRGLG
jgi:predicted unusual protein kinase regulating ubiquinone biosynthesis (AarF/ABC1/UbiB family)